MGQAPQAGLEDNDWLECHAPLTIGKGLVNVSDRAMSSCVESLGLVCANFFGKVVDPGDAGGCGCCRSCREAFWVPKVVVLMDEVELVVGLAPRAVVDLLG